MYQYCIIFLNENSNEGIKSGKLYVFRHVVYGPSKYDSYSGSLFPGLSDSLFNIEKVPKNSQEGHSRWEQVKHEVARLSFTLEVAAATISPVTDF